MFVFVVVFGWWCGRSEAEGVGIWSSLWARAQSCLCEWMRGSMLSLDNEVIGLVVAVEVVTAYVSVSVERNVLDSKAESMFARTHAWPQYACCNRMYSGYSPRGGSWPCESAHAYAQGPRRSVDYPAYRTYGLGAVPLVLRRARDAYVVTRDPALGLIQGFSARKLACCLHGIGVVCRH
jgi:hypothetical protein